ncbi:hypothetical protein CQA58_03215 [Helicobacter brantae]|uniref:Uncharacterized protein n=1 Tax=Helicobacter brantae TaxID=375927 RepID=A0A3D8J1Q6_9HELI|nr:hypothetical protein CQA58_03215 [Helicobacter brantae]
MIKILFIIFINMSKHFFFIKKLSFLLFSCLIFLPDSHKDIQKFIRQKRLFDTISESVQKKGVLVVERVEQERFALK